MRSSFLAAPSRKTRAADIVYIVDGNKAVAVPVKVGVETDTLAQVISPKITAGTQVITTRPDALKDGSIVAVNNGQAAPAAGAPKTH